MRIINPIDIIVNPIDPIIAIEPKPIDYLPPKPLNIVSDATTTIKGQIVDLDGQPIMATVVSKNDKTIWAESDFDGFYKITVPINHILEFRSVGFAPKQIYAKSITKKTVLKYDKDNTIEVDLGTITTVNPTIDTTNFDTTTQEPKEPKEKESTTNYGAWILGTFVVLGVAGVLFNKNERKKMALAGGVQKKCTNRTKCKGLYKNGTLKKGYYFGKNGKVLKVKSKKNKLGTGVEPVEATI